VHEDVVTTRLREFLRAWEHEGADPATLLEDADDLFQAVAEWGEVARDDPRSIPAEVALRLEEMHHRWVVPEDVPAMVEFLDTPTGAEAEAWDAWDAYWGRGVDWDARALDLADDPAYAPDADRR
jgi:hypothetical protein